MIVRLGLVVAASVAAYTVRQINVKGSKPSRDSSFDPRENGEAQGENEEQNNKEEEEKEEAKLISGEINPASGNTFDTGEDEFEELLSGQIGFPLPDEYDAEKTSKADRQRIYDEEIANNASELERLRNLVKELEEREVRLEGELLEYYGMKEQESDILELQRQLKIKAVEIDMLKVTISSLQAERKKLQEEIDAGSSVRKELEIARNKVKELQTQIQLEANQTKGQLLLLKQTVSSLQAEEEEAYKRDSDVDNVRKQ